MQLFCENCGDYREYHIVRTYTDDRGCVWEVYRCTRCGHEREYAVQ